MAVRAMTLSLTVLAVAAVTRWSATLEPKADSKISGKATVEAVGTDSSRASIQISGGKAGSEYPWHIHNGACGAGAPGAIVGNPTAYPVLTAGPDGNASASVVLPGAPMTSGDYSVTVHRSKTDKTPASCGTLKSEPEAPAPMPMPKDSTPMKP